MRVLRFPFVRPVGISAQVQKRPFSSSVPLSPPIPATPAPTSYLTHHPSAPTLQPFTKIQASHLVNPLVVPPPLRGSSEDIKALVPPKLPYLPDSAHTYANIFKLADDIRGTLDSKWNWSATPGFGVYFSPTNNVDEVLPKEFHPTCADFEKYAMYLNPILDRAYFADNKRWEEKEIPLASYVRNIAIAMNKLLRPQPIDQSEDNVNSNTLFRDVLRSMDVGDGQRSPIDFDEEQIINVFLREQASYTTKIEFVLQYLQLHAFGFVETDKTPSINTYLEQDALMKEHSHDEHTFCLGSTLGQKVGEAIALVYHNLNTNPLLFSGDQEIFGVSVHHYYFTFWHAYFPASYLKSLFAGQSQQIDFGVMKCYPASAYGLNYCDPAQRREIYSCLHRILKYNETKFSNL